MMVDLSRRFGQGSYGRYGQGAYIQELPEMLVKGFLDFSGGYFVADVREDVPPNTSPNALDVEVDRKDRLRVVPGVTTLETLVGRNPIQMVLHASLDYTSELVLFDPPFIGVKSAGEVVWQDIGLPVRDRRVAWTNFGGTLIFNNGEGPVRARQPGASVVEELKEAPQATTYASFAGRLLAGGGIMSGNWEPLGVRWSAASSDYDDWNGLGGGFELLINDMSAGDHIVSIKAMGLDFLAVCMRRSIWVGRRTGLRNRPVDFQPRVSGIGFVNQQSVQLTSAGVMGLSDNGVYIFDGNEVSLVSEQINAELLPLDFTRLVDYSAAYNPVMQHYMLMTPSATFIFDIPKNRWYRRSLIARSATMFAEQLDPTRWGDFGLETWDSLQKSWRDFRPGEGSDTHMHVLADGPTGAVLGVEDVGSRSNFGAAMDPYWETPILHGEWSNMLLTIQRILLDYEGAGAVNVHTPDIEGTLRQTVAGVNLPSRGGPDVKVMHGNVTGRGVAARIDFVSGDIRVRGIRLGFLQRSPRIENTGFVPREYYHEFLG